MHLNHDIMSDFVRDLHLVIPCVCESTIHIYIIILAHLRAVTQHISHVQTKTHVNKILKFSSLKNDLKLIVFFFLR